MKAIVVNVHKESSHYFLNGLTFPIREILSANNKLLFCLEVNGNGVDFTAKEIAIVDFAEELQKAFDNKNWDSLTTVGSHYNALVRYAKEKGISFVPEYSCPA